MIASFSHIVPQADGRIRVACSVQTWPVVGILDGIPAEAVWHLVETAPLDPLTVTANGIKQAVRTACTVAGVLNLSLDTYFTSAIPDRG